MAIAMIFAGPSLTQANYDQVHEEVTPNNHAPQGLLYHVAGAADTGFCVVEVWESQEAAGQFFQEKLGQALRKANIEVQPQVLQVHNIMQAH